jgi:hypothetical protein
MEEYEKLGAFYLGRLYDLQAKEAREGLLLYDSRDLVTHAVCVGMTGSGKTGLCISLIEEAAIDNVPAILIDPKGDLGNLLLTFPQLRAEDFLPWVDPATARQKDLAVEAYAEQQAALWKKGLAGWGQSGERIQRLRDAADFKIYTPGSSAGLPVSILKSFAAPGPAILQDTDLLRERISTTVTSLLGLVGIQADPIQSREHILLSTILDLAWRQGHDLDLAALIQQVQTPPVNTIGVLNLESFYPAKDRFGLMMALNNLLASPGFGAWMEGEALDIGQILYTPQGKPRISIFSIAHLGDAERMFFVSLLLNQVLSWMRGQPGTTSLRALVYMDEVFGYLPPVGNPPSKLPLMTLLKQARAFGVGIVLSTQNPVDLDYKALSNAGTWFIGRLQTERDKARLLDGLEGAAASTGMRFDRRSMEEVLAGLGQRVFLLNNVKEDAPEIFQTRWAMSYLCGPLTQTQIRVLMEPYKQASGGVSAPAVQAAPAPVAQAAYAPVAGVPVAPAATVRAGGPPALPLGVSALYVPPRGRGAAGRTLVYQPSVLGAATVRFVNAKAGVDTARELVYLAPIGDGPIPVSWADAQQVDMAINDLDQSPQSPAQHVALPAAAGDPKNYTSWRKDLSDWLYGTQSFELLKSAELGVLSEPGESERDFRIRLQQSVREHRDQAVDRLEAKYASKMTSLQEKIRRAEQVVEREKAQHKQAQLQSAVSVGSTLLGALMGRKVVSSSTVGRATTAARGIGRSTQQRQDVRHAEETLETLQKQLEELDAQFRSEAAGLESTLNAQTLSLQTEVVKPRRADVSVQLVTLAWVPFWQDELGGRTPAWT